MNDQVCLTWSGLNAKCECVQQQRLHMSIWGYKVWSVPFGWLYEKCSGNWMKQSYSSISLECTKKHEINAGSYMSCIISLYE